MKPVAAALRKRGRMSDLIAAAVLDGSDARALDTLRVCGCKAMLPGVPYATATDVAEFYGVTTSYLKSVMTRNGITHRSTPSDCFVESFRDFALRNGLTEKYTIHHSGTEYSLLTGKEMPLVYHHGQVGLIFSARLTLATAALMYYGRIVDNKSRAAMVYQTLLKSTYGDEARDFLEKQKALRAKPAQKAPVPQPPIPTDETAVLGEGGVITMTSGFFAEVIRTAVKEAISEYSATTTGNTGLTELHRPVEVPKSSGLSRKKPDGWDEAVRAFQAHEITAGEASARLQMSKHSFYLYRTGRKVFDS